MKEKIKTLFFVSVVSIIPTLLVWIPFAANLSSFWNIPLPKRGMETIISNYDNPLYIVVAKSLYDKSVIKSFPLNLPTEYYAAHFPTFPTIVKMFSFVIGYPYSTLLVTMLSAIVATYFFYKLSLLFTDNKKAVFLTFVFSFLPARWLILKSIGSPEPLFIAAIMASIYYFTQKKYLAASIWGIIAQLTKSPGILLFVSYFIYIAAEKFREVANNEIKKNSYSPLIKYLPIFLIPVSLVLLFYFYKVRFNDFFAYFHSGNNIHLFFPPFQIFNYSEPWVGTFWIEEIILVYLIGFLAFFKLVRVCKKTFGEYSVIPWFYLVFFTSILFVAHRDLIRYALPLVPFILIAYSQTITQKKFKYILMLLIIPIYLFSLSFISNNVMPISNWGPFL